MFPPMKNPPSGKHENVPIPERVVEIGRGCYNCIHYDTDEKAKKRFADMIKGENVWRQNNPELVKPIRRTDDLDNVDRTAERYAMLANDISQGIVGVCTIGKNVGLDGSVGMFTSASFFCGRSDGITHWKGRDGHSMAAGAKGDKPRDELLDIVDSKAKKI